jgi:multicomponent Na+:H+ antiporter subunit D
MALVAVSAMSLLSLANLMVVLNHGEIRYVFSGWPAPFGIEWVADALASVVMSVLCPLALVCLVYAGPITPQSLGKRVVPYYTLILLLIGAITGIVFAADLFNVFVFLEVAALAGYALVGMAGGKALVSAFRYLILGTLGASLYLLGVGYIYAATGTLNMADLAQRVPDLLASKAIVGGLIFMFLGLAIKMALMPLHGWLPGAYTNAPEAVSPFLASLVTKVALLAWVRIMFWVVGPNAEIDQVPLFTILQELGALAAVVGAFLALTQHELKRMFAYAGISHIGLILIGVSLGNPTGFAGGVFYLINDMVMQAALFFLAGIAVYQYGVRTIEDLGHLRRQAPWMIGALIIMAMGMVGFPPTGGFFGKWYIILGAIEAQNYVAVGAVLISTVLTLAYFVKLFERIFRDSDVSSDVSSVPAPLSLKFSVGVVSAAIIILGLCSDPIVGYLLEAALPTGL